MTSRETKSLTDIEDKSSGVSNDVLIESLRYQLAQLNPEERMEFGGQEMFNFVMRPVYNSKDKKMSIELLLYISSLMAGCACQMAAMADNPGTILTLRVKGGETYYAGDAILQKLFGEQYSPWSIVGGGMKQIGQEQVFRDFDIQDCIKYSMETMGSDKFGVIRMPDQYRPEVLSKESITELWNSCTDHLRRIIPSVSEWPGCYGVMLQKAIVSAGDIIKPDAALTIIAESMLYASKLELRQHAHEEEAPREVCAVPYYSSHMIGTTTTAEKPEKFPFNNSVPKRYVRCIALLMAVAIGIPATIGVWSFLWRQHSVSCITGLLTALITWGTYGLITRSYPAVLDRVILGIIAVVGTIVGFAYCINNLLPIHTMNNFLVVLQSMTSPSFWSALWGSNHEFVSAFVISLFSAAGFIPYIRHRISKD